MDAKTYIASSKADYDDLVEFDKRCGLLTRSKDRSEIIKVANIIDDKHYEYFITTKSRLDRSGINYAGKEVEEKPKREERKKKERRYEMVFYPNNENQ